mgnify:CR=1 FL=1
MAKLKPKKKEEAVLDFVIISDTLEPSLESMIIDEMRQYPLTSYLNNETKHSDHYTEIIDFNIGFKKQPKQRVEHYNFKDKEGLAEYIHILNSEDNLTKCVDYAGDLTEQVDCWFSELENIFRRCFRKVRVGGTVKETDVSKLLKERSDLIQDIHKNNGCGKTKDDLENIEAMIASKVAEENYEKIMQNFSQLDQSEGGNCSQGIWDIKAKVFPKSKASIPAAKNDPNNRLVTDPDGLKKLYLETFTQRLRTRPPKESVKETFELQQTLLEKRLAITADRKSPAWTENEVKAVIKSLKTGKSRDPLGLTNEIFREGGDDLNKFLTIILNKIKDECIVPEIFIKKNISAIYKGKGSKLELNNDRGIFVGTVLNTVLQKLIHKSIYDTVDANLGDSNVGGRKNKNIRTHSLIVNSIMNETVTTKARPIDLAILDFQHSSDKYYHPHTNIG